MTYEHIKHTYRGIILACNHLQAFSIGRIHLIIRIVKQGTELSVPKNLHITTLKSQKSHYSH
jgi:hypothetical protein